MTVTTIGEDRTDQACDLPTEAHTDEPSAGPINRAGAEALAARLMAAAADITGQEAAFLGLLGEFEASGALTWWYEDRSLAAWVSRMCALQPGTAREHVRVARALRRMPKTAAAFRAGDLSFSKVRELTRLVDDHDELTLLDFARHATASQLARTVRAHRAHSGTHQQREMRTRLSWTTNDDGLVRLSAVLTPEQGAAVVAALEAATDEQRHRHGEDGESGDGDPPVTVPRPHAEFVEEADRRSRVEALVAIANHWSNSHPADRSGEDRTAVVVEINAGQLVERPGDAAQTETETETEAETETEGAPAGPSGHSTAISGATAMRENRCSVRGFSGIEPATARRLCCEADVQAIITGLDGEPLHVGRSKRYGTRAQRRALMLRDGHCGFPGCGRTRRLKVHHIVSWLDGGPTDLDNLMLLCQHHHTVVHEGGISIAVNQSRKAGTGLPHPRWLFRTADSIIVPEVIGQELRQALPPLGDPFGKPLTGPAREAALARRRQLIAHQRHVVAQQLVPGSEVPGSEVTGAAA